MASTYYLSIENSQILFERGYNGDSIPDYDYRIISLDNALRWLRDDLKVHINILCEVKKDKPKYYCKEIIDASGNGAINIGLKKVTYTTYEQCAESTLMFLAPALRVGLKIQ